MLILYSIFNRKQDNLGTTRLEVERLRGLLQLMYSLFVQSMTAMRERLRTIKDDSVSNRAAVERHFEMVAETWDQIKDASQKHDREVINRLTVDHELELNDIKKYLAAKDEEIDGLRADVSAATERADALRVDGERQRQDSVATISDLQKRIVELERQTTAAAAERTRALNEVRDKMLRDHKTEIESLRSRFKLMTNMERSPSDTSLERVERPDCLDIQHDLVHIQMPPGGAGRFSSLGAGGGSPRSPSKGQDMYRQILAEKEQQLDELRERERVLSHENRQHKETIQQLADADQTERQVAEMRSTLERVQMERGRLEKELTAERTKRAEMETSVAVDKRLVLFDDIEKKKITEQSCLSKHSSSALNRSSHDLFSSSSTTSRSRSHCSRRLICIESCSKGDNVLVFWNPAHGQYTIYQVSFYTL